MNDEPDSATLVRRFTGELVAEHDRRGSNGTLETLVVEEYRQDERRRQCEDPGWRKYFEPSSSANAKNDDEQARLSKAASLLKEAWAEFRKSLPPEESAKFEERAPTFKDVEAAVADVEKKWERNRQSGKFAPVRRGWKKCCNSIKSHETMLKVIPEGNEYVSIFSGVLKSVVYATANHERVALSLSKALCDIGDIVERCLEVQDLFDTQKVKILIMELYAHILLFFKGALEWYRKNRALRMLHSFNEDLYDAQQDVMNKIREIAHSINERVQLGIAGVVRATQIAVENTQEDVQTMLRSTRDIRLQQDQQQSQLDEIYALQREEARRRMDYEERLQLLAERRNTRRQSMLADKVVLLVNMQLTDQADSFRSGRVVECFDEQLLIDGLPQDNASAGGLAGSILRARSRQRSLARDTALSSSAHLEDFFDRQRVRIDFDQSNLSIPEEAATSLQSWIRTPSSTLVAIAGPDDNYHSLEPSTISATAAAIVSYADAESIPVISYFCELDRWRVVPDGESMESQGLIALISSLIRQLVELLPPQSNTTLNLEPERFQALDGTMKTWKDTLKLLEDLLGCSKPVLYCIVDGLQCLDHHSTENNLEDFVEVMKRCTTSQKERPMTLKVLFTTSGRSSCLLRNLSREEMVLADDGPVFGQGLRGRQGLAF